MKHGGFVVFEGTKCPENSTAIFCVDVTENKHSIFQSVCRCVKAAQMSSWETNMDSSKSFAFLFSNLRACTQSTYACALANRMVYMSSHTCTHIHRHTCMHVHTHTNTHVHTHTHTHACTCAHTCNHTHICTHTESLTHSKHLIMWTKRDQVTHLNKVAH